MDRTKYIPIKGVINFAPKAAEKQYKRVHGKKEILEFARGELVMINYTCSRQDGKSACLGPLERLNPHLLIGGCYYIEGYLSTHLVIKASEKMPSTYEYEFDRRPCSFDSRMSEQLLKPDAKFLERLLAELEKSSQPFAKSWQEVKKDLWKLK